MSIEHHTLIPDHINIHVNYTRILLKNLIWHMQTNLTVKINNTNPEEALNRLVSFIKMFLMEKQYMISVVENAYCYVLCYILQYFYHVLVLVQYTYAWNMFILYYPSKSLQNIKQIKVMNQSSENISFNLGHLMMNRALFLNGQIQASSSKTKMKVNKLLTWKFVAPFCYLVEKCKCRNYSSKTLWYM